MKKYIFSFMTLLVVALCGLSLTSCSEDDLVPNTYQQGVALNVFGPSPVVRGGTLRFIGSNLDQIQQVIIPGVDPITSIEVVKAGVPSEIRVVVPKDGPEVGKVQLIDKTGKTHTTQTELTYTEDIVFDGFTPESAMPGQEITISGDYLNLIHMVEFNDGVQVGEDAFTQHDRYTIKVVVPDRAKTGKVSLYDVDLTTTDPDADDVSYNIISSEKALNVGTPTVSKLKGRAEVAAQGTITAKQGETITITGTYFNLVGSVCFGGEYFETGDFTASQDGKTITMTLDEAAPDGDISIRTVSGVLVPVGKLETVAPTELAVNPNPAKNLNELTITGKDMDVVSSITFPNAETSSAIYPQETSLSVTVPELAQEGDITLTMSNGKSVTVPYTLVKPVVTAYSANPVSAGGALSITGTNLDLVASVTFNGSESPVTVGAEANGTAINLTVPMDSQTGAVTLNLKNGTNVTVADITVEEAVFCYATALPGDEDEIHAGETMTLTVKNQDKLTGVEINGTACQYVVSKDQLVIGVPEKATKKSTLRLISSNGEISYEITVIPNTETTTVLWTGVATADDWGNQPYLLSDAGLELAAAGVVAGDVIGFHISPLSSDWKVQIVEGHWGDTYGSFCSIGNDTEGGKFTEYDLDAAKGYIYITLTQEMIDKALTQQWWGGTFLANGDNVVIDKITTTHYESLETELWSGEAVVDDWGNQPYLLSDAGVELAAAGAKAGQTIRFYVTPTDATWNLQIVEGHWGETYCDVSSENWDLAANNGAVSITLTQAMLDKALTQQWWGGTFLGNGDNIIITKITIE